MHDFSSDAIGRDVSLKELPYWSEIDLQTLSGELKARLKEVNTKIARDNTRGVYNKRLLNVRTYLECFRNKAVEELNNHYQDNKLPKALKELTSLKKQLNEQKYKCQKLQSLLVNFQRLLAYRFGAEAIQEIAAEATSLTPSS